MVALAARPRNTVGGMVDAVPPLRSHVSVVIALIQGLGALKEALVSLMVGGGVRIRLFGQSPILLRNPRLQFSIEALSSSCSFTRSVAP